MKQTASITGSSVYTYANELIVELTGVDEDGDFVVLSCQFDYADESIVTSKQPIEGHHEADVRAGLSAAGYDWNELGRLFHTDYCRCLPVIVATG